jgi:hypothetical protein
MQTRKGFYSSNKDGGEGYDDIYKSHRNQKTYMQNSQYGKITDIDSKASIINSQNHII